MKRIFTVIAVVASLIGAMMPTAGATPPDEVVYLSLGTSLAAGSMADPAGDTTFSSSQSYTDQLDQRVTGRIGIDLAHVKLGCPGESTDQFMGGLDSFGRPSACVGLYDTGSQQGDALATIAGGNVVLVTIDIGANDILNAQILCLGDPGCIVLAVPGIAAKVAQIVGTLRGAGYGGPILAMNYYNPQAAAAIGFFPGVAGQQAPDPGLAILSDLLAQGFNGALEAAYGAFGVQVVDVYSALNSGDFGDDQPANGTPDNLDVLCALSYMCPDDPGVKANIHLNKRGYKVVAKAFFSEVKTIEFDK